MLNAAAKLVENIFEKDIAKKPTRDGFGTGTVEAGKKNPNVVVLCADLSESTRAEWFQKEFPERFIEMGIAEQNMAATAAGLALTGKVPFMASYAAFSPGRNYEQIRTTIALNEANVKIGGMHAGVSVGPDGATHQMLEDMGLMRMLPNMIVLNPCDAEEARKAVVAAAEYDGPVYIRFGRSDVPVFTTADSPFAIGASLPFWSPESGKPQVAIFATGSMSYNALAAARALHADGIEVTVIHNPSVKPLDESALVAAAKQAGRVITVEEHQVAGGFGSAVAELLAKKAPVPMEFIGIQDEFGQSGNPDELIEHYGLAPAHIAEVARRMVQC
ncbi:MAG TPA: transketolase C-terminal domain-containing protein [Candidatus Paceibacterota bacterium]|nr:transketolase C-terminal domain-containing protein [Candidatus Paceibacterota bacterium]